MRVLPSKMLQTMLQIPLLNTLQMLLVVKGSSATECVTVCVTNVLQKGT